MPIAPTKFDENLRYRREIIKLGDTSESARKEIILAASRDPVWFTNTFLYTFDSQNYVDAPERPLVLRKHQLPAFNKTLDSVGKNSLIFPKSRRMGVTTLILAAFFWRWMYRRMQSFLLLSAKQDRVDRKKDPSSLFWKLDFMMECLPVWMRVPMGRDERAELRFYNPYNGSVISGESTNNDPDRGGVRTAVLVDEVASMLNSAQVINAVGPLTESLYLVSTPKGAYGGFYEMHESWKVQDPERIVLLHWTMHEVFSKGLYFTDEPVTGYIDPAWKGRKPRSPWYDKECLKLLGPKHIAQELDIAWNEAGGRYFEEELVQKLLKSCRIPSRVGEFDGDSEEPRWLAVSSGHFKLWCPLSDGDNPVPPRGRYGIGVDAALGTGGTQSSQSVLSVVNLDTGEKVARFAHNRIPPPQLARLACKVAKFFCNAKIIAGSQGPGVTFHKTLTDECRYYNIYYRQDVESPNARQQKKAGYSEQGQSRQAMFDGYADALLNDRFKNPDEESVHELRQFILSPTGSIEHSAAMQADDPVNKGKLHGDMVVADALVCRLLPERIVTRQMDDFSLPEMFAERSAGGRWWETQRNRLYEEQFQ